jgi:PAS domain S-box-containing protein
LLQIVGEIISETQVRCRSDEEVRIAAQEWQITFDGVADAVFVLDAQQRITRCNKAAATLFGESVEQIVGRHCFDIVHKTRQPIPECPIARMKRSRQRESMELAMNGRWYQVVVDPLFDRSGELRGAVHAISDITARKQAEEALRNTAAELDRRVEQRTAALKDSAARLETLRSMVNRGPVVLFLWRTVPGRWPVEMVSDNVASVLGYTEEDFMSGRVSWPGITCREDVPRLEAEVARFLEQDVPEWSQEYRVTTKAGKVRWIQDWNRPIKDASGAITHIQGMIVDVTARKHAESVLAQTERALRLLAEFDHALLRRSSERELLRMACRVAVGVGGYRMAWVGYAEHDACKSVRPMELVGLAKGYLSRVTVTWGDDRLGRGPVGTAIRTGKPGLCRDISKDPLFAPWRKEALKRGCASLLALPLMTEQRCIGALAIYSAHANAFSDSEIRLLQQLANDLSFGIMALRGRKERRELEQQVLDISDREQRRIGQDLHDGVGQSLAGIRYLISAVQQTLTGKSAPEAAELERIAQILGKTVQQTHDLARGLFPGELRRGGIADALRELAVYTQEVFGVSCRLTGLTDVRLTDANVASQLYRIAQEAITNAAKHSKTKTVDVHLSQKRGRLALTVHDTGVGLPQTAGNPIGMGQRIMKYRADMIGATLKIKSAPGKGTTVTCVLPSSPPPAQGERGQRAVV